jgi:hypothetical protein
MKIDTGGLGLDQRAIGLGRASFGRARHLTRWILLLSLVGGLLGGCSKGPSEDAVDRFTLQPQLRVRMLELISARGANYVLKQAEFQESEAFGLSWVFQFNDPLTACASAPNDAALRACVLGLPLELYRDAVASFIDDLRDVEKFFLAFRDPKQTVIEIEPADLRAFVAGRLTTAQFETHVKITSLR